MGGQDNKMVAGQCKWGLHLIVEINFGLRDFAG